MTRLIDADALKKAITEATYNFEQIPIRVDEVQEIIDNAPTVEPDLEELKKLRDIMRQVKFNAYAITELIKEKDDDLCETCKYGDTCGQSDKGVSFAKHSKCWKYRYEGERQ